MRNYLTAVLSASVLSVQPASVPLSAAACVGDCDGGGTVTVNEIVRGINIALGTTATDECPPFDSSGDGAVTVDEIVTALSNALGGCPPESPTATVSPRPTVATPSPTVSATDEPALTPTPSITSTGIVMTATPTPTTLLTFTPSPFTPSPVPTHTPTGTPTRTPTGTRTSSATPTSTPTSTSTPTRSVAPRFRDFALSSQAASRLGLQVIDWLRLLIDGSALAENAGRQCPAGGSVNAGPCTITAPGSAVQTLAYQNCATSTAGHTVSRSGSVTVRVQNEAFCQTTTIGASDAVTVITQGYTQSENAGASLLAAISADVTLHRQPTGRQGCNGADANVSIDGALEVGCTAEAASLHCPVAGADVRFEATGVMLERRSGGFPCEQSDTAAGQLHVEDRAGGETLSLALSDLTVTRSETGGTQEVGLNGRVGADCIGELEFITESALEIPAGLSCPVSGSLRAGRPGAVTEEGETGGSAAGGLTEMSLLGSSERSRAEGFVRKWGAVSPLSPRRRVSRRRGVP